MKPLSPPPQSPKCLRCGQCCHYYYFGAVIPCPFLINLPDNKTACLVYGTRLTLLDKKGKPICLLRKNSSYDFVGCPYNTGKPFPPNSGGKSFSKT